MKKIMIQLYQINELTEEAKHIALDQMRHINVDTDWWDFVYYDFKTIAAFFGIDVSLKKTWFTGFYHQGQGSSYTATVDILKMFDGLKNKAWKQYAPKLEFDYPLQEIDRRVIDLINRNIIDATVRVTPANRETSINVSFVCSYTDNQCTNYKYIENQLRLIEELVEKLCNDLNNFLFTSLMREYDHKTGDETVMDAIEANQFEFTANGKFAGCLEKIAMPTE